MKSTLELGTEKREYFVPIVEILMFSRTDVLCMSNESNDNEFDAGEMGNF
ncbi:MAG: hypothetical protein IJX30_07955 [Clostridia bacterium]|nr:hypothetical protein [Clostridia bacterium]